MTLTQRITIVLLLFGGAIAPLRAEEPSEVVLRTEISQPDEATPSAETMSLSESSLESTTAAVEPAPGIAPLKEIETSGPYCGIYSLIAVLDTFGIHPKMEELLVPEYVGSFAGSSNVELIQAAEKFGLHGKSHAGLSWKQLKQAKSPMILHFRSSYAERNFNHWVTFLGVEGNFARIIDLPHNLAFVPPAELLAQWDGAAIEISDQPITRRSVASTQFGYGALVVTLFAIAGTLRLFWNRSKEPSAAPTFPLRVKKAILQTAILLSTLFITGILFHTFSEIGFLKNPTAVAEVTRRYYSVDIPEITLAEMEKIVTEKSAILYDARFVRDFQKGTFPNAQSLSINSTLAERQAILNHVKKNQRLVVFCQSSGCGYADEVAQFLKFNGYHDVVIYRGGYREWTNRPENQQQ